MVSQEERTSKILDCVLPCIKSHQQLNQHSSTQKPFVLGITGLQGCGKSTLASEIVLLLNQTHRIRAIEVSLDDFYQTHDEMLSLRKRNPSNTLLKVRGQPGTHDDTLAEWFFGQFSGPASSFEIPSFDKSRFNGEGDRLPRDQWRSLSREPPIEVLVFEGWCVGFQPLSSAEVETKWNQAKDSRAASKQDSEEIAGIQSRFIVTTLADHSLESLQFVNSQLQDYCARFMGQPHFDYLVHLDTQNLANVYSWRMEQEHMLRKARGSAMTDSQVVDFVQGYMPAYELYLDELRNGFFSNQSRNEETPAQLHVLLDIDRVITRIELV